MEFTLGADPEFVLLESDGSVVSAIGRVAPKDNPTHLSNGGSMFADNVLVELNFPPASNIIEFLDNIRDTLRLAAAELWPRRLYIRSSLNFPYKEVGTLEAYTFGCTPEWNAWKVNANDQAERVVIFPPRMGDSFRSCGGHIHLGIKDDDAIGLIRELDMFVGIPSLLINWDSTGKKRRTLYGGAGHFRSTGYGVEYRTPSNFWLASPILAAVMYRLVQVALDNRGIRVPVTVAEAIDGDREWQAMHLWEYNVKPLLMLGGHFKLADMIDKLCHKKEPLFYKSWNIEQPVATHR